MTKKDEELAYWKARAEKAESIIVQLTTGGHTKLGEVATEDVASYVADALGCEGIFLIMFAKDGTAKACGASPHEPINEIETLIKTSILEINDAVSAIMKKTYEQTNESYSTSSAKNKKQDEKVS